MRQRSWLGSVGYSGRKDPADLYAHLQTAPRGPVGPDGAARAHVTRAMLNVLNELVEQIANLEAQIAEQLALHADAHIFQSLPRGGTVRAARLLAEIGDVRGRFPDHASLACLAGVAPSTKQSGKHKAVTYRWAVNKELRDAVCDSPAIPAELIPGPRRSTTTPSLAARTIPTPPASWPEPGSV